MLLSCCFLFVFTGLSFHAFWHKRAHAPFEVLGIENTMLSFADRCRHDYTCLVAATVAFVHLSLLPDWITFHLTIAVSPSRYRLRLYSHMCCDMIMHVV